MSLARWPLLLYLLLLEGLSRREFKLKQCKGSVDVDKGYSCLVQMPRLYI